MIGKCSMTSDVEADQDSELLMRSRERMRTDRDGAITLESSSGLAPRAFQREHLRYSYNH